MIENNVKLYRFILFRTYTKQRSAIEREYSQVGFLMCYKWNSFLSAFENILSNFSSKLNGLWFCLTNKR